MPRGGSSSVPRRSVSKSARGLGQELPAEVHPAGVLLVVDAAGVGEHAEVDVAGRSRGPGAAAVAAEELHGVLPVGLDLQRAPAGVDGSGQPELVVERDGGHAHADVAGAVAAGEGVADVELDRALAVELAVEVRARPRCGRQRCSPR